MSILSLVEDRPTPKCVYNWRIYLLAGVASLTSCMIGYDSAFIGTTLSLPSFKAEFNFESMSDSKRNLVSANIVSCYQAGAFFGALFAYGISPFWGRRIGLFIASLVFTVGAGLMLGANGERGLGLIYAGRVLAGLGVGAGSNFTPIYIAELAPPAIRGRLIGVYELGWQIGGLVGFWINVCISDIRNCLFKYMLTDIVRRANHTPRKPQAVDHPICCPTDPVGPLAFRYILHPRIATIPDDPRQA